MRYHEIVALRLTPNVKRRTSHGRAWGEAARHPSNDRLLQRSLYRLVAMGNQEPVKPVVARTCAIRSLVSRFKTACHRRRTTAKRPPPVLSHRR
jgi:hypothetical protein